jgi:hypothetical protein
MSHNPPSPENHAVYDATWKNVGEAERPQMTIWRMCFAFRIHKATNTNTEYVKLIALPLQQWMQERA